MGDCIGKGAFGAVYKALNQEDGSTVAIKVIDVKQSGDKERKNALVS